MKLETIEQKREYLENNLQNINTVLSGVVGCELDLKIEEYENWQKQIYFTLEDDTNFKYAIGIMGIAFRTVTIQSCNFNWKDNGFVCEFQFSYEHCGGGYNAATFCWIECIDNFTKIKVRV